MKNRNLKIGGLIALVVAVAVGIGGKKAGWWGQGDQAVEVEVGQVTLERLVETVNASGKIQPSFDVAISPEVSGEIRELYVKEGQKVQKGDVLLRINPDIYQSQLSRGAASVNVAKSAVSQSEASFREAKRSYDRSKKLHDQGVLSDAEWDQAVRGFEVAELTVESARFQLQSAQSGLREAEDNLKRTTLRAPIAGTVTGLSVELGERVVGTAQMAGTELMRIAQLETMEVVVDVNENDIVKVKMGDTALVQVDAYMGREFKALVTEIGGAAKRSAVSGVDQVTNFEVVMTLLPESYADLVEAGNAQPLRPGMTATVNIQTARAWNVPAVPIQAVTTREDSATGKQREVVFLIQEGKAVERPVVVGIQDDRFIQIAEGLKPKTELIVGPYDQVSTELQDGKAVKKQTRPSVGAEAVSKKK
jgi:HlyD family secretion protein